VNLNTLPEQQIFSEFDTVGVLVLESVGSGFFIRARDETGLSSVTHALSGTMMVFLVLSHFWELFQLLVLLGQG
jgi:hypothetical protein